MISEAPAVELLDVFLYREKKKRSYTKDRLFCALSFRLSGESVFRRTDHTVVAKEGSIAYVPSGLDYDRVSRGVEEIAVFHFLTRAAVGEQIEVFVPSDADRYRALFLEGLRLWEEKEIGYRYAVTAIFYQILAEMQRDGARFFQQTGGLAEKAAEIMGRQFRKSALTVASIAEQCFVSEAYLRRRFRDRFGISPKAYLDDLRISHACSLLKTGYYAQKEIASRVGYTDVKYFRTAFKRHTGMTPSEYVMSGTDGH